MGMKLAKDSIDIGIVVSDGAKALAFYRDTLGFNHVGDMAMPGGGGTMHRLMCGTSLIKVVDPGRTLDAKAAAGGIQGAYGYRYWTISVTNLEELTKAVGDAGYKVVTQPREIRPGVRIAMVEDPDGNWVEFLQTS
jgi:catechol 2,3-dioxygenase-like lactoylglutathione lyase family enzyme